MVTESLVFEHYRMQTLKNPVNAVGTRDNTAKIFSIALKASDHPLNSAMHKYLSNIILDYRDGCPKRLTKGLPPHRDNEFAIDHVPDAKPKCRGIYSMSQPELEEVQNTATEIV